MKVYTAVGHTKGGVGKSATTVNLASVAAQNSLKVLVMDWDPQATASNSSGLRGLGVNPDDFGTHRIIIDGIKPSDLILETPYGYDLIPASDLLYQAELTLKGMPTGSTFLKRVFMQDEGLKEYDLIICDTQGAPSSILAGVIDMCGSIIIPDIASEDSTGPLNRILPIIDDLNEVREMYGQAPVNIRGHFFNFAEPNTQVHKIQTSKMIEKFGDKHLVDHDIPRATDFKKAAEFDMPLVYAEPNHRVSHKFKDLFKALMPEFF